LVGKDSSFSTLRRTLKALDPPCIPYLGMYLKDLTFIEDGNNNYITNVEGDYDDIVNFEKMRKLASTIQDIFLYQQKPYNFRKEYVILQFIESRLEFINEDENYLISRRIEPKEMIEEFKRTNSRRLSIKVQQEVITKVEGSL